LKEEDTLATLEEGVEGDGALPNRGRVGEEQTDALEASVAEAAPEAADAVANDGAAEDETAADTTGADEHTHAVSHVTDAATDADAADTTGALADDAAGTHLPRKRREKHRGLLLRQLTKPLCCYLNLSAFLVQEDSEARRSRGWIRMDKRFS